MEEDGECMVAFINGVYDAGITVTVVGDGAEQNPHKSLAKNNFNTTPEKSYSVETHVDSPELCDRSSQIYGGHFARTHQAAHCSIRTTSPPVQPSEFPPQRLATNTGASDSRCLANDAFIQSLRKYPNVPSGALSDELVQRLLTYTQAKNLTKSSYHTKVMRSATVRYAAAERDTRTNSSKNIQTYARTRKCCKENGNTTDRDIKFDENSLKKKGLTDSNNVRSKDSNVNFTYDYLRGSSPVRSASGRAADVRYLTDVKKYIRDTVRQMCQERNTVCPRIRSRYSNHRREHHRSSLEQELNSDSNNARYTEDRASSPLVGEVSVTTQYETPTNNFQTCSSKVNLYSICKKHSQCSCRPGPSKDKSMKVLTESTCVGNSSELKDKTTKEIVIRWIKSIPVYANESKQDKLKRDEMVKELIEVLDKTFMDEDLDVKKVVDDFLVDLPMWCPGDDNERKIFKKQLAENLVGELIHVTEQDAVSIEIANWLKNITFDDDKAGMLKKDDVVQVLKTRIKSVKRSRNDENFKEDLISEITNILKDLPIDGGSSKNHSRYHLASDLANKLITIEKNKINQSLLQNLDENISKDVDEDLEQCIIHEVSNIFHNADINVTKSKEIILQNKIAKILYDNLQNQKNNINDKAKKEIVDLLEKETDIHGQQADIFANSFLNKDKVMSLPIRRDISEHTTRSNQLKDNITESVKEEVNDIFSTFKIEVEDGEALVEGISNLLEDEIVRGEDINRVRQEIHSLLHDANVSEEQAASVSDELTSRARQISLCYKTKDSTLSLSTRAQQHRDSFKRNVAQVLRDFIKTIDVGSSPKLKAKVKQVSAKLVEKVTEIMLHSDYDKNAVFQEILIFLENLPLKSKFSKEDLADQLMKMLQSLNIHSSTPHKERFTFRPHRESTDSTISSICFEYASEPNTSVKANDEEKYSKALTEIFSHWVNSLPVNLNATDAKTFRDTMINDLVADIIDRKKYFQLNPTAETSVRDELEHLKYQVFRWFNKLPTIEDLTDIMLRTEELLDSVNNVPVPSLVKPIGQRKNNKLREGKIPTYIDALQDELSLWMDEIPKDLCLSIDRSQFDKVITELAEKIQGINNTETNIEDEITIWLKKITKSDSHSKLKKNAKNLLNRLKSKGFTDEANWIIVQNSTQFIEENFDGALKDWLKDLPIYITGNSQERFVQEKIVSDIAKDMRRLFDSLQSTSSNTDSDKLLVDEIMKHLKRFPMEIQKKTDENYIRSIALQLLNFLKGLQIFQDISFRQIISSNENLESIIEDWIQSLSLVPKNSIEKSHLAELTKQFKETIKQLQKQQANNQIILDQIRKYLIALPIELSKKNNHRYLNDKAQQLLNNLQNVIIHDEPSRMIEFENFMPNDESNFVPKENVQNATDILYENIENWCEKLPVYGDDIPEEKDRVKIIKQNIASKLMNKIGELNMDQDIFYDDFIYDDLLKDELESVLNVLPIHKEDEKYYENLKLKLFNQIKEVKDKIKTELAGQRYKQRLKDATSKTLSLDEIIEGDDEAFFQNLKDDIADAFINLHYFEAKPELQNKFKNKISEQIYEFCNNYLKRYPATPIDTSKLNKELYSALKNVPVPTEESIRNEVEQTRMKDKIQDWMNELPLKTETIRDKQHRNKITSIMSKRLHDIDKNKKVISNYTEVLKTEIMKWLKKIPLKPEGERLCEHFAEKLIDKIKQSEESREFSPPFIQTFDQELSDSSIKSARIISPPHLFPHSSLTPDDHALLQRVRKRTKSNGMVQKGKDASLSPPLVDAESQTDLRHSHSSTIEFDVQQTSSAQTATQIDKTHETSSTRTTGEKKRNECVGPCSSYVEDKSRSSFDKDSKNRLGISPRVIVKEYHWDSTQETPSPYQYQTCADPSGVKRPPINKQLGSCGIPSVPRSQPCVPQTSRYLPSSQNHHEHLKTNEIPDPKLIQTGLQKAPLTPTRKYRRPLKSLDAVKNSALQRFDSEWSSIRSHQSGENNDFSRTPGSRRHTVPSQEDICQPYNVEWGRTYEKVGCKCRECILTKCSGRNRSQSCQNHDDSLNQCPRCCGTHCPYPSNLYFRK